MTHPDYVIDRHNTVWRVIRNGRMAIRPDEFGTAAIGIAALAQAAGPLIPFDPAEYRLSYPRDTW